MNKKNRIRNRLLTCILVPIVAMLFATTWAMSMIVKPYLEELLVDRMSYTAEQRVKQFNMIKNRLYSTAQSLIANENMQQSLVAGTFSDSDFSNFENILRSHVFDDLINITYISSDQKKIFHAFRTNANIEWALSLINHTNLQNNYALPVWKIMETGDFPQEQLFVIQKLRHLNMNIPPGYLLFHVRIDSLEQIVKNAIESEHVFILNQEGDIILPKQDTDQSTEVLRMFSHYDTHYNDQVKAELKENRFTSDYSDLRTGWRIISYADYEDIMSRYNDLQKMIVVITIIILLVSGGIIYFLTFQYTKPITIITRALDSFRLSKFQSRIEKPLPDDFASISDTFNNMADQIESLLVDVEKGKEDLKIVELESLMYQINPHFIYNTLNNIYMEARLSGQKDLSEMIDSLSRFLRISLSKGSSIIPIDKEIEHVSTYLAIQRMRYEELFTFRTNINQEITQLTVLKFILQPFVENCITHGFVGMTKGGKIEVNAYAKDNGVCFEIVDNGRGMSEDIRSRLNSANCFSPEQLKDLFPKQKGGYGIGNVIARLQLYYKDEYSLSFQNVYPGTKCSIWIKCTK